MARKKKVEGETLAQGYKQLTKEQQELYDKVVIGKTDPVYFVREVLGVELHDGQKLWLWMTTNTQHEQAFLLGVRMGKWKEREEYDALIKRVGGFSKNILVPSNRWGKTLVTSVKHLWYNFYKIGVQGTVDNKRKTRCGTLNLSPHSNQADAGYQYILDILFSKFTYRMPEVLEDGTYKRGEDGEMVMESRVNKCLIPDFYLGDNSQRRVIQFKNGSFYKAVPTGEDQASSLAGNPYLYISYDECAQSLHLKAELPAKIMSRLIDFGGPLDLVSTPEVDKPSHQYFSHIARMGLEGKDGWYTMIGKLGDNHFLGEKERRSITEAIRSTDPAKYRQVAYGEFITTGKKMFDSLVIERLWDRTVQELPALDRNYLLCVDWGFADTGDPTVMYVLDYTPFEKIVRGAKELVKNHYRVVFRESIRGGSPFTVIARARMLQREWNGAKFIHDSGNMGGVMIKKMLAELGVGDVIDFSATGEKSDMLFCLLVTLTDGRRVQYGEEGKVEELNPDFGRLRSYYIAELEEQMGNYQYNPDKGVSDKRIEQDDIMALGMGIWWLERKHNRSTVKMGDFNPLANSAKDIFPDKTMKDLAIHNIDMPEKRIF